MSEMRTAYLGQFGEFEESLVVEILEDHGIFATSKHDPTENVHEAYVGVFNERGIVLVDASRLEDAKRIVAEELPQHLASIREAMEEMERAPDMPALEATLLEDAADTTLDIAEPGDAPEEPGADEPGAADEPRA